jgi:hypothetical protein
LDHQGLDRSIWVRLCVLRPRAGPRLSSVLSYSDAINVMKVIVPIFAGYLGSAVLFVGAGGTSIADEPADKILSLLVRWPVFVFVICMVALLVSFPLSNGAGFTGKGMTPNTLSLLVSLLAALLAATTGGISSYLFKIERRAVGRRRPAPKPGGAAGGAPAIDGEGTEVPPTDQVT